MSEAQVFEFRDVKLSQDTPKQATLLCRTDRLIGAVQIIRKGGENNMHSHRHLDGMWTVISGRARFYGEGDVIIAELGQYEGILIPRGFKYWFECASEEESLVILQVESSDMPMPKLQAFVADRQDHAQKKEWFDAVAQGMAGSGPKP